MSKYEIQSTQSAENNVIDQEVKPKYFLTEESFNLLRQAQQVINEKTEIFPSLRKLVNELVTEHNVKQVINKLISNYVN